MAKNFCLLLLALLLCGCVTEPKSALPMALAPNDTARASCLTYSDMPTFSGCESTTRGTPRKDAVGEF